MKSALFLLLLAACSFRRPDRPVTPQDVSRSVYKIDVDVTVLVPGDQESDCDPQEDDDCEAPPPVEKHVKWMGTAWVVDHVGPHTYMMTAGHVCETADTEQVRTGFMGLDVKEFPIKSVEYKFESADGGDVTGARVLVDDDKVDLCVLAVQGDLGTAIPLGDHDPKFGQDGFYIGAPHGLWGNGVAGIFNIKYMGRGNPFKGNCSEDMPFCDTDELAFSSAEAAGGASGSPMIVDGYAVAVLNFGPRSFGTWTMGVPWEDMHKALAQAKHEEPKESL